MSVPALSVESLSGILNRLGVHSIVLGYSGGLDSSVLLHLLVSLRKKIPEIILQAVHVHHGFHPEADQWATICEAVCQKWEVPLKVERVTLDNVSKESVEAQARRLRYDALMFHMDAGVAVLTGHHQDDQAETLLLQGLRGAGISGLAAMPESRPLGKGRLVRPLLQYSREAILTYAKAHELTWIEDTTNSNPRFDRNYLRSEIMPRLKSRWPSAAETLSRSASHCAEVMYFLNEKLSEDFEKIKTEQAAIIDLAALRQFSETHQRFLLRYWLEWLGYPTPSARKLLTMQTMMLNARADRRPEVPWGRYVLRRFRQRLYAIPREAPVDTGWSAHWDLCQPLVLPGNLGVLKPMALVSPQEEFLVRFRQGGERLRLHPEGPSKPLSACFLEWGVPPWERSRIPLIFMDNTCVSVVGHYADPAIFAPSEHAEI